jgi:hypothetical protein
VLHFSSNIVIINGKWLIFSLFLLIPPFLFDVAPGLLLSPGLFYGAPLSRGFALFKTAQK